MLLADLHAVAPAPIPEGSIVGWLLFAIIVAAVVTAGMFLSARR